MEEPPAVPCGAGGEVSRGLWHGAPSLPRHGKRESVICFPSIQYPLCDRDVLKLGAAAYGDVFKGADVEWD